MNIVIWKGRSNLSRSSRLKSSGEWQWSWKFSRWGVMWWWRLMMRHIRPWMYTTGREPNILREQWGPEEDSPVADQQLEIDVEATVLFCRNWLLQPEIIKLLPRSRLADVRPLFRAWKAISDQKEHSYPSSTKPSLLVQQLDRDLIESHCSNFNWFTTSVLLK